MRINSENLDLKVCVAISSLLVLVIAVLPNSFIRVLLGLPFVLFLPGYVLVSTLFPMERDLSGVERVALGTGSSIAVVSLIGLGLNYTPFGIGLNSILTSLLVFIFIMSFAAYVRRMRIPPEERFSITVKASKIELTGKDKPLYAAIAVFLIASMIILFDFATAPKIRETYTEFYILDENMKAENYPVDLTLGEEGKIIIGVGNNEYRTINYTVRVNLKNETLGELSFPLRHGESMTKSFILRPNKTGENMTLEFLLYKDSSTDPYRSLHLWINVKERF